MYNPIEEKRHLVQERIAKSFNSGINVAEEIDLEKAWNVGDEKQYQGVTYYVGGFNAKGQPLWRKKKDGGGGDKKHQETHGNKKERVKTSPQKDSDSGHNSIKIDDTTTFVPKKYFNDAEQMAKQMNILLQSRVNIQKFVDILGDTVHDKGVGTKYRQINAGSGHYSKWDNETYSYLQADGSGDYLQFKKKPSKEKLNKCSKMLKDGLAKVGYDVEPKFYILDHNPYYQTAGTYGIGISIKVTKEEWKKSSKRL